MVCVFKQPFSVFKQHFTYFNILFHPHVFPQIFLNNNFQFLNTQTKRTLNFLITHAQTLSHTRDSFSPISLLHSHCHTDADKLKLTALPFFTEHSLCPGFSSASLLFNQPSPLSLSPSCLSAYPPLPCAGFVSKIWVFFGGSRAQKLAVIVMGISWWVV